MRLPFGNLLAFWASKQDVELCPGSGEIAYFEVSVCGGFLSGTSIGLASHLLIEQAEALNDEGFGYYRPDLGYSRGSFGWSNGYIQSSLSGVICSCRIPHLRANAGDQIGIMVDCSSEPTIRFFVNGCQFHHLCGRGGVLSLSLYFLLSTFSMLILRSSPIPNFPTYNLQGPRKCHQP